jgi:Ca-activated chloride channel family protein
MAGDKMLSAAAGAQNFIGRMSDRDEVHVLGFGTTPYWVGEGGSIAEAGEGMTETVGGLIADGNTALYDAVCVAANRVEELRSQHEAAGTPYLYGIVLLSDGADRGSERSENQMLADCLPDGESVEGVRVYTIAFGADANLDLMTRIANRTNGRSFEGDPQNIERIYTAISAEQ